MNAIFAQPTESYMPTTWNQTGSHLDASSQTRAFGYDRTDQEWTITTREGDTVTLNIERESATVYGSDAHVTTSSGSMRDGANRLDFSKTAYSQQEWHTRSTSNTVTLTVDGDLNKEELKDIRKAIRGVEKMMRKALMGLPTGNHLNRLSRLDSLSEIAYSVEREQVRYVSQESQSNALVYGATGQMTPNSVVQQPDPLQTSSAPDMDLIRRAADRISNTGIPHRRFKNPLARLFETLRRELQDRHPDRLPRARHLEKEIWKQLTGTERTGTVDRDDRD